MRTAKKWTCERNQTNPLSIQDSSTSNSLNPKTCFDEKRDTPIKPENSLSFVDEMFAESGMVNNEIRWVPLLWVENVTLGAQNDVIKIVWERPGYAS